MGSEVQTERGNILVGSWQRMARPRIGQQCPSVLSFSPVSHNRTVAATLLHAPSRTAHLEMLQALRQLAELLCLAGPAGRLDGGGAAAWRSTDGGAQVSKVQLGRPPAPSCRLRWLLLLLLLRLLRRCLLVPVCHFLQPLVVGLQGAAPCEA
jgi:hypothetical protein